MTDTVPRLGPLPSAFATTRDALHQLAFFVLAPRRYEHTGRLGLRATPGGFGTPWFDGPAGRERVRTEGAVLVRETGSDMEPDAVDRQERRPGSLREACEFVGVEYRAVWFEDFHDPLSPWDPDRPLELDDRAARALADWFAFGTAVLEQVRTRDEAVDPSSVQLWPEHFDPATEVGAEAAGRRASVGASPGDADHDQPYLYVAPWGEHREDPYWDDEAFGGASLPYDELVGQDDQLGDAVAYLVRGVSLLGS